MQIRKCEVTELYVDFHWNLKFSKQYLIYLFGFKVAFNTVKVISQPVVLWAEETSTYSWSNFCIYKM